jgi:hypothetical protein
VFNALSDQQFGTCYQKFYDVAQIHRPISDQDGDNVEVDDNLMY